LMAVFRRELLVLVPAVLNILFGLLHQGFRARLVALQEHAIASLVIGVLLQRYTRGFGVEDERVFPLGMEGGVVAIEGPVARLHGQFLLFQALAHLNTVSDTMAVGDD